MAILPEKSVPYKTFVKTALVLALREAFKNHPDPQLRRTKVAIDYPNTAASYPTVIIRFFEREIANAGVGHIEFLVLDPADAEYDPNSETVDSDLAHIRAISYPFRHFLYNGDIEFAIVALSSKDRDLISDALVTILASGGAPGDMRLRTGFFDAIYNPSFDLNGAGNDLRDPTRYNFVNLNTDKISGFGETQTPAPWLSEDQLQYQSSYRLGIMGEFYSLPPEASEPVGIITKVNILPYIDNLEVPPVGVVGTPAYNPPTTSTPLPAVPSTTSDVAQWSDWG
jgi:hypothetical protein